MCNLKLLALHGNTNNCWPWPLKTEATRKTKTHWDNFDSVYLGATGLDTPLKSNTLSFQEMMPSNMERENWKEIGRCILPSNWVDGMFLINCKPLRNTKTITEYADSLYHTTETMPKKCISYLMHSPKCLSTWPRASPSHTHPLSGESS